MSEAAVKRSDLANFDPDTPLEKLDWAREEMQRNFQQPMSARAMRVCTVCSERWDTAEDGGGDYRWVVYRVSREHSTAAAVGFHFGVHHTMLPLRARRPHSENESSPRVVPRVCRVIPCPMLLVRASYHTVFSCDNNSVFVTPHSEHQLFWWDV